MSAFPPGWETLERSLQDDLAAGIAILLAGIATLNQVLNATNASINSNPAVAIKAVAGETKTLARGMIRIARLLTGAFDSDEIGT